MDRLARIAEQKRLADEGRAEIARREEKRAADPFAYDPPADYRITGAAGDLHFSAPTGNETDTDEIIYKQYDGNALAQTNGDGNKWDGWEKWLRGHLDIERNVLTEAMGEIVAVLQDEIERLRQEWQADKRDRSIRDQTIVERSGRIAQLQKENAEAHAQLTRTQWNQALAERDARLDRIETQLGMLLRFIGGDLPRGFGRE